jgi:hypothetical protein
MHSTITTPVFLLTRSADAGVLLQGLVHSRRGEIARIMLPSLFILNEASLILALHVCTLLMLLQSSPTAVPHTSHT